MKMELLAPGGSQEAAIAAFRAGADACYVGGKWSARAYAKNLDDQELSELLAYAHLRKKKVYVALNTMLLERELEQALAYTRFLYESGVDAIIAADLGYIRTAHAAFPDLPFHASTQMGVHTAGGALAAQALGCTRIVAAREATLADLADMAATGIEVEAFCHGALCSSVSGACLFSSMIGGRSGNRGRCAQPCRLPYTLVGEPASYLLSTADLETIGHLEAFRDAGVCSLKIEGRMKRKEYVAVVTRMYRQALDALEEGRRMDVKAARQELAKIYNRGGFTQGYYWGNRDVTYPARPGHLGVYVGRLKKIAGNRGLVVVEPNISLEKGDGVEFRGQDSTHGGLTLPYADRVEGGYWVSIPKEARRGDQVYRTTDAAQMRKAAHWAEEEAPLAVEAVFCAREGSELSLCLRREGVEVCAQGEAPPTAQHPVDLEARLANLAKTGGTPFVLAKIEKHIEGNPFVSAAAVNALRREGLAALEKALLAANQPKRRQKGVSWQPDTGENRPYLACQVRTPAQAIAAWAGGADRVYYHPRQLNAQAFLALERARRGEAWLVLPPFFLKKEEEKLLALLEDFPQLFTGGVAGNLGQIVRFKKRLGRIVGDFWLNAANGATLGAMRELGAEGGTHSLELTLAELQEIGAGAFETVVFGRQPVMNLRHCPIKKQGKCPGCDTLSWEDRKGYRYPLTRAGGEECLLQVLNPVMMAMGDLPALIHGGQKAFRLLFWGEEETAVKEVTQAYRQALDAGREVALSGIIRNRTNTGRFYRPEDDAPRSPG